eukprot:CAMPEP_0114246892 /NCGR_PEP_ID=MMETSP0058-20121206/12720_1 /TAXON_ID=36894 /ORGANISM="Pyramimonas parkeae, CCMP726" /LENGTH=412 /DNA_ID=CAMNT_0001360139 /DNA_START=249 /DNA_END=1487 /DNA_ORIENTATION=+
MDIGVIASTGDPVTPITGLELFVCGRVCLFGEHSDWAGGFRSSNPDIAVGRTIVVGTSNYGLFARVSKHPNKLILTSTTDEGEQMGPFCIPMEPKALLKAAKKGGFWSYAAGVAYQMSVLFDIQGIQIDNYSTTLPIKKGLSSSAALCVLVARAFNQTYCLKLSIRGEMEFAYQGEILTPSKCGRMDQACAFGAQPVCLDYDGDQLHVEEVSVGEDMYFVIADLHASKDTVIILKDLQAGYPFPKTDVQRGVHKLLGEVNQDITSRASTCLAEGDLPSLGALMEEAQVEFDRYGGAACPSQLTAPMLHKVLKHKAIQVHIWGGKGVGSQGDGTAQFLCKGRAGQDAVCEILERDFPGLHALRLDVPATTELSELCPKVQGTVIPCESSSANNHGLMHATSSGSIVSAASLCK